MSYDIHFYRVSSGFTAQDAHNESFELDGTDSPRRASLAASPEDRERIAAAILATDPDLEREGNADFIQLCGPVDNPFDWCVSDLTCSLSWTYGKSDQAMREVLRRAGPGFEAMLGLGYQGFDPQLDRTLAAAADWELVAGSFSSTRDRVQAAVGAHAAPRRPWWRFW